MVYTDRAAGRLESGELSVLLAKCVQLPVTPCLWLCRFSGAAALAAVEPDQELVTGAALALVPSRPPRPLCGLARAGPG